MDSRVDADIKSGQLKNVYLLFGEEKYFVSVNRKKLLNAFTGHYAVRELVGDMNFRHFSEDDFNLDSFISFADTMPFFAERRFILVDNCGLFAPRRKGEEEAEEDEEERGGFMNNVDKLSEYLDRLPETTYVVFVENKVDARSKLYKKASSKGLAIEYKKLKDNRDIEDFVTRKVAVRKMNITRSAMDAIIQLAGDELMSLQNELEKLFAYVADSNVITVEDVKNVFTPQITDNIFGMIDACAEGNRQRALDLYYELLELREPPLKILSLLGKKFAQILTVKDLRNRGFDKGRITEKTGLQEFIVKKCMFQADKFSSSVLKKAVEDCANYEQSVKTGLLTDRISVEMLLIEYSGRKLNR